MHPARAVEAQNGTLSQPPMASSAPVIVIDPLHSNVNLGIREAWASRELLYFLALRDLKVRYKQTILGIGWAVLQPVAATAVFTLFFGKLANLPSDGVAYPVFVFAGLLPWMFFANALQLSGNSLVANVGLLTKIYVPRILIPASSVVVGLVDLLVGIAVLVGLMVWFHAGPNQYVPLLLAALGALAAFTLALGVFLSALNVRFRDVKYLIPFLLQLLFFLSPIIYPPSFVPNSWRWVLDFNPLTGIIQTFRAALIGHPSPDWAALGISFGLSVLLLLGSIWAFHRMERGFADTA